MNRRYNIYPSLLDSFTYMMSLEDEDQRSGKRAELLAQINRLPHEPSEALSKGTALNELIDSLIEERPPKEGMAVEKNEGGYGVKLDGFDFFFEEHLVDSLYQQLLWFVPQVFMEGDIMVNGDIVHLYGFADYVGGCDVIDLKTTKSYAANKYRDNWQRFVYPYCLWSSGLMSDTSALYFTFKAVETSEKNGVISGRIYDEQYLITKEQATEELRRFLQWDFLPWLNDNRDNITDKKIFNL